mgnify:CR=1 FL=1
MHWLEFLKQFLTRNKEIGAIAESSDGLAELITEYASVETADVVLELGPGTGVFTEKILEKMADETTFFALEVNPRFVEATKRRCPQSRVYQDTAVNARKYMDELGVTHCDAIVSGLPWAVFHDQDQERYLDAMMTVLRKRGQFVTFGYLQGLLLPAARRFRRRLEKYFNTVEASSPVWSNFPPAIYYHCRR